MALSPFKLSYQKKTIFLVKLSRLNALSLVHVVMFFISMSLLFIIILELLTEVLDGDL